MNVSTTSLRLTPDAAIDLQLHTIYSDGTWTPDSLLDHLIEEQFGLVAITDHDRVDTLVALQHLAIEKNLPVLVAVEMSTHWKGELIDVLCYGFDPENNALDALTQDVLRRQQENTREVYAILRRKGYLRPTTLAEVQETDELAKILEKPSAQQPHELSAILVKHRHWNDAIALGKILTNAGVSLATTDLGVVVEAAHRSGAICLIAHPGRGAGFLRFDATLLDQLRSEVPLDGIEVYYPVHTPEQVDQYFTYAEKHHLLTSSGSDSHGPDNKPIRYRAELSRRLLERLGIQIA